MIRLKGNVLLFQFPEIHDDAEMAIEPRRTLRVPTDGRLYKLPPSHQPFPLQHIDDCKDRVPEDWRERGGVLLPMYQGEAMYLAFSGGGWVRGYPFAVKIGAGKVNAITGGPWRDELDPSVQDYIVVPRQPRFYGYCTARGQIRQFVAMPLGSGYPLPEQITEQEEPGGLQLIAYPMKADHYERTIRNRYRELMEWVSSWSLMPLAAPQREEPYFRRPRSMSLAAGGRMKQPVYRDPFGVHVWEQKIAPEQCRCFVTLADALQWQAITRRTIPYPPPTPEEFAEYKLPWLDVYASDAEMLGGAPTLATASDVSDVAARKGDNPLGPSKDQIKMDTVVRVDTGDRSAP